MGGWEAWGAGGVERIGHVATVEGLLL